MCGVAYNVCMDHEGAPGEKNEEPKVEKAERINSFGELMSFGKLETKEGHVYRGVNGQAAIDDLFRVGYVRNAREAGVPGKEESKYGKKVYWSKGKEGGRHVIGNNYYVIEALPHGDTSTEEYVRLEDVTGIYTNDAEGNPVDVLPEIQQKHEEIAASKKTDDEMRIEQLKKELKGE